LPSTTASGGTDVDLAEVGPVHLGLLADDPSKGRVTRAAALHGSVTRRECRRLRYSRRRSDDRPLALAPPMPAVGFPALKKAGVLTTGGAAFAVASVARPADPEDRGDHGATQARCKKTRSVMVGLTYTL
jgi:hypothetical protein